MKATDNKTLWAFIGQIKDMSMMAKSVIIYGKGCFIKFLHLATGEEHHLTLNNHTENGDGVKCFTGHHSLYVFAYCENCQNPYIYIKSYPDFQTVAKLSGEMQGYKSLIFSDFSLIFALGEMPNNTVTVWNWRSLETFAASSNELFQEDQLLRCSYGRPMYLAQLGVGSRKLFIWDVFTVGKQTIFEKHEVLMGDLEPASFENVVWSTEGVALYIIDLKGSIYTVDKDFYLQLVVDVTKTDISGSITPSLCWYQHGLIVSGPNQEIRHYKKIGAAWICDSSYPTEEPVLDILNGKHEKCIGRTEKCNIVSFGCTLDTFAYLRKNKSHFQYICIINPVGEFMIVERNTHDLDVYKIETGETISTIALKHTICSIVENPTFPLIATGNLGGYLTLVSFYDERDPKILVTMYLAKFDLTTTRFFENGNFLVTGNWQSSEFFILKALPGTQVEVIIHLEIGIQVADYTLNVSQNIINFFIIPITEKKLHAGNRIDRYCILDNKLVNVKNYQFKNNKSFYRKIFAINNAEQKRSFYLIPFLARCIEKGQTRKGDSRIAITEKIPTGHQIKQYSVSSTARHKITWGHDGFIFVKKSNFKEIHGMALCHHRNYQGVKQAITNPSATIIVSLGYEGVLVATQLLNKQIDDSLMCELKEQKSDANMAVLFKRSTLGFDVEERFQGKCWKELQLLKTIEVQEENCRKEKNNLLKEFLDIKEILESLVTENIEVSESQKLDLLEFYLDASSYQKKQQQNKEECKKLETYLKALVVAQDKVSNYIITKYYLTMGVQWQNIMGIFSQGKATNYCLLPVDIAKENKFSLIEEHRKIERCLSNQDVFEPWNKMSKKEIQELKSRRLLPPIDDYYTKIETMLKLEEISDFKDSEKPTDTQIALAGTVYKSYIKTSTGHYKQTELNTYYQSMIQEAIAEKENVKLKQIYNKCFLNTRALKERKVYNICEKNSRLREIVSEYNYFSDTKIQLDIVDPKWAPVENVETAILKVIDNEIPVRPFVSPSEQAILDAKAAEEKKLRLTLLEDDFREAALLNMMNGVLEVRWEDELKTDIPKPKCMLKKNPEFYNEDDLQAIADYENKAKNLQSEREKYKRRLEVEFNKLSISLRDSIQNFNQKLYDCTKFKFYVDSGINQENLIVNRQMVIQNQRIEIYQKEQDIIQKIKMNEVGVEENQKAAVLIHDALQECKATIELMTSKEKQLEKAYRKDFQDMPSVIQEQAFKLYKKRPKINFRIISTATLLIELAKGVLTNEITFAMTKECVDYMKALEHLDAYVGVPTTIDENIWNLICKYRRHRVEYEIRFKAAQIQIFEGESTLATFQKRVATKKEKIVMLKAELAQTRANRLTLIHKKQVQLVLTKGLVEIPLTGDLCTDFIDAILVPKSEIHYVNSLIVEAGKLKLKTIQQNMKFRRTVMATEWNHMKLRMLINDYIEQKKDIETVKFTKQMQDYLKLKSEGRKTTVESYEHEVKMLSIIYENKIKEEKEKSEKLERKLKMYTENNKELDKKIKEENIGIFHYKLEKDDEIEAKEKEILQVRMSCLLQKNRLVQKVQENHNEILVLQAELELLRLRTFPTFKYKLFNE